MKRTIITLLLIFSFIAGTTQSINWKQTQHWKLYSLNRTPALKYPADTLSNFKYVALGDSSVIEFLSHSKLLPKTMYAAWMGFYIGSYETNDRRLSKVIFSNYGGFFYESFTKRYYEIPENLREKWQAFITKHQDELFSTNNN
jgi:hypothetical protein